jgi:Ca2+-binding RTX toxin-like protein
MARFVGTSGNDTKRGIPTEPNTFENFGIGSDTLTGGLKTDLFYLLADEQVDSINGSDGIDRLDYTNADRALRIDLGSGSVTAVLRGLTYTVAQVQNVEDATGSRYDDTIIGTAGSNTLDGGNGADYLYGLGDRDVLLGGAGTDRLYGGDQDDTLLGGIGNDYLNGGNGIDTVSYADVDRGGGLLINLGDQLGGLTDIAAQTAVIGPDFVPRSQRETDNLVGIENATGTEYSDAFDGGSGANVLDGAGGNDIIRGHRGDDTLLGGEGDDQLEGGMGADQLIGGNGVDWVDYAANLADDDPSIWQNQPSSSVVISLINPASNTWWAAGDTYDSIENVFGSPFNDVITGNDNDNIIVGFGGSNTLYGNGGRDTFVGSSGQPDTFNGGNDSDTVDYSGTDLSGMDIPTVSTSVTIDLQNQGINAGAAAGDVFIYVENIIGTSLSDTILGNNLNNDFRGGEGADRLMGRGGTDTLRGDGGIDTAVFRGNVEDYEFRVLHFNEVISDTGYPFERFLEVRDLTGNRDGTDYVIGIEQLEFNGVVHNISEWIF